MVIMTLHQPRYAIFKLLDTVTLLNGGKMAYQGPSHSTLDYFKGLGKDSFK